VRLSNADLVNPNRSANTIKAFVVPLLTLMSYVQLRSATNSLPF
jgi:hypothetical protein